VTSFRPPKPKQQAQLTTCNYPRWLPRVLSSEEMARLIEAALGPGLRYKAALSVVYGAGLRASEGSPEVTDTDSLRLLIPNRAEQRPQGSSRDAPAIARRAAPAVAAVQVEGWLFPRRETAP
jgi:integrase/recombinase XerD